MAKSPTATDRADIELTFIIGGKRLNVSAFCKHFEFKALVNGGYMIMARLINPNYNILRQLNTELDYLKFGRKQIFECEFRLLWLRSDNKTEKQTAFITSLWANSEEGNTVELEFIGVDPPSWFLNTGDASGKVFKGRVSDVIRQCVQQYTRSAIPPITLEVTQTRDSAQNQWWMMRQDPKSFILSLLDWSSSITPKRTQWFVIMDGRKLLIKEQAELESKNVGFYLGPHQNPDQSHISSWELLADNSSTILNTKLVTQGMSAISGQYLDRITDKTTENQVFAKDQRTGQKYKPRIGPASGFTKPSDDIGSGPQSVGWSVVSGIPEIYSAGDLGLRYNDYIDGRPRAIWLNMANLVMRFKMTVIGHGIYSSCRGLGTDTISIGWKDIGVGQPGDPEKKDFFLAGNWLIYGFHHFWIQGNWKTDLYCARLDHDAVATEVPRLATV